LIAISCRKILLPCADGGRLLEELDTKERRLQQLQHMVEQLLRLALRAEARTRE